MRNCDYCGININKTLVTEIECSHIFCIHCSSLVSFNMEVCPKCQSNIRKEKIYFYDPDSSQKQKNQQRDYQIDKALWNLKLSE